jgi:hypothetical protein
LVWYENDGAGNFTPRDGSSDGMMGGVTFRVADLDRNGFPDFLTASSHGEIVWQKQRVIGDSNEDGQFDSADLVHVFQTAQYEDGVAGNSRWEGGDWNGDGEFDTADLVLAFQSGNYADAVDQLLRNGLKDNFATSIG